jgi:hypothetical protein
MYYRLDSIIPGEAVTTKAVDFGGFAVVPYVQPPVAPRSVPRQRVERMPREGVVAAAYL